MGYKGDWSRPFNGARFRDNYDKIFRKAVVKPEEPESFWEELLKRTEKDKDEDGKTD